MFDQLKKRVLDVVALAVATGVGLGGFYGYSQVKAHSDMDRAIIDAIRANTKKCPEIAPPEDPVSPVQ